MREILFRGKTALDNEWVIGAGVYKSEGHTWIITDDVTKTENRGTGSDAINPETVGEFTGLYNGAGQKIFEDDIVRFEGNLYRVRREDETPGGVWSSTAYILQQIGWDCLMSFEDTIDDYSNEICVEIVGNIHDNPELLKYESEGEG